MSKKYQLRLKATKTIQIIIGKKKPLSISKQLKYFGTHTNNLESKFKTKKGFLDLMKYAIKHMPLKEWSFSIIDSPFTTKLNETADQYDQLYDTFHYFQHYPDYEEFKTLIGQSKGNVSQFIAERYYLAAQCIDDINFLGFSRRFKTTDEASCYKAITQQYQTLSTNLAKHPSILNTLNVGILGLMLAKYAYTQKKQGKANTHLDDSSKHIMALNAFVNAQEQQVKRSAGALETQKPYKLAKLELIRLLEIASKQRSYKTPKDLMDSLVSDMKYFANTKNGRKPAESNMERTIRNWLLKDENINIKYNLCLKNCIHP